MVLIENKLYGDKEPLRKFDDFVKRALSYLPTLILVMGIIFVLPFIVVSEMTVVVSI